MYELIILGLLMWRRLHGYDIWRTLNELIGPFARASNSMIFPLLARLEKDGLATSHRVESDYMINIREFEITEAGRARFRKLMADTRSRPRRYRELFAFKAVFFPLLDPAERLRLVNHYVNFCRAHTQHLRAIRREGAESESYRFLRAPIPVFDNAMEQSVKRWNLEIAWAGTLLEEDAAAR